jgi:type 1 glutamine amidotransferase
MNGRATLAPIVFAATVVLSGACADGESSTKDTETFGTTPGPLRVLFFQEEGPDLRWYHSSTPIAEQAMRSHGAARGWEMTTARSSTGVFTRESLERFDVVVYLVASGLVTDASERAALEAFIGSGKGYVGVHSASAVDLDWDWYAGLVGTRFHAESTTFAAELNVHQTGDAITSFLPPRWARHDQWYGFHPRPEENPLLEILVDLDESSLPWSYPPDLLIGYHPIAWRQTYAGGRSFYTAMGHGDDAWSEEPFVRFIGAGIEWAGTRAR